jgi:hypothetical protein
MLFEIKNCVLKGVIDITSGTSKTGNAWTKGTAILEHTDGNYTDTYPMLVFGDEKVQKATALAGSRVDVRFDIKARQYNGRWYTDINAVFINPVEDKKTAAAPAPAPAKEDDPNGDLPF